MSPCRRGARFPSSALAMTICRAGSDGALARTLSSCVTVETTAIAAPLSRRMNADLLGRQRRIDRHRHAAGGQDREIDEQPVRPAFGEQRHALARLQARGPAGQGRSRGRARSARGRSSARSDRPHTGRADRASEIVRWRKTAGARSSRGSWAISSAAEGSIAIRLVHDIQQWLGPSVNRAKVLEEEIHGRTPVVAPEGRAYAARSTRSAAPTAGARQAAAPGRTRPAPRRRSGRAVERGDERLLVDQPAACDVDEDRRRSHRRQFRRADHRPRLRRSSARPARRRRRLRSSSISRSGANDHRSRLAAPGSRAPADAGARASQSGRHAPRSAMPIAPRPITSRRDSSAAAQANCFDSA